MVLFLTFPLGKGAKKEVLFCELGGGGSGRRTQLFTYLLLFFCFVVVVA